MLPAVLPTRTVCKALLLPPRINCLGKCNGQSSPATPAALGTLAPTVPAWVKASAHSQNNQAHVALGIAKMHCYRDTCYGITHIQGSDGWQLHITSPCMSSGAQSVVQPQPMAPPTDRPVKRHSVYMTCAFALDTALTFSVCML